MLAWVQPQVHSTLSAGLSLRQAPKGQLQSPRAPGRNHWEAAAGQASVRLGGGGLLPQGEMSRVLEGPQSSAGHFLNIQGYWKSFCTLSASPSPPPQGALAIPILQMRKLRLQEVQDC